MSINLKYETMQKTTLVGTKKPNAVSNDIPCEAIISFGSVDN
jgi:hypothetical protein